MEIGQAKSDGERGKSVLWGVRVGGEGRGRHCAQGPADGLSLEVFVAPDPCPTREPATVCGGFTGGAIVFEDLFPKLSSLGPLCREGKIFQNTNSKLSNTGWANKKWRL